jgi:Family of unknown function (DUF6496)
MANRSPFEISRLDAVCTRTSRIRQRWRAMAFGLRVVTSRRKRMPEKKTLQRARADKRAGKSPSTQAGEFVREEIHHVREGKHGARSSKQAIAIGLSKARRAGVKLPPPGRNAKSTTRKSAESASRASRRRTRPSSRRSRAVRRALKREGRSAASPKALSRQAASAARRRSAASRSAAARKAARTRQRTGRRRRASA